MAKKKTSRLTKELLETAGEMREVGLLNRATHEKITMRHLGAGRKPKLAPITGEQVRAMREQAKMSQAVLGRLQN